MIPRWIYTLMVKHRARCGPDRDEHGRPLEEKLDDAPCSDIGKRIFPGYADFFEEFPQQAPKEYKSKRL